MDSLVDKFTNKTYFYSTNYDNNIIEIYDESFKKIASLSSDVDMGDFLIIDNQIYFTNKIYDLSSNKIGEYDSIIEYIYPKDETEEYKYIIIPGNTYKLFDIEKRKVYEYKEMEYKRNYYIFSNDKEKLIIDEYGNIIKDLSKVKLRNGYYIDYSVCDIGGKLKDENNNIIYDECSSDYDLTYVDKDVFIANTDLSLEYNNIDEDKYIKVVFKDKILEVSYAKFVGEYIYTEDFDKYVNDLEYSVIYDLKGNKLELKEQLDSITNMYQIGNNYVLNNKIYDKSLSNVIEEYDNIYYFDAKEPLFKIEKDDKKGIYYKDDWLIDLNDYWNIESSYKDNNYYILENLNGFTILEFDYSNKFIEKKDIKPQKNKYEYINVDEIIKEYNLQENEDIIKKNETLFKKYSYIILNKNNLKEYDKYLFNIFKIIIDNSNQLKENYLLQELNNLTFEVVDDISKYTEDNAAGLYSPEEVKILLSDLDKKDKDDIIYHELLHFIDDNINGYVVDNVKNFYKCDDNYFIDNDYDYNSKCESHEIINIYNSFLVEGGAEFISNEYFSIGAEPSYDTFVDFWILLSYIFSEDTIKDIYFDKNTGYEFYKLIVKENNMDVKDYIDMILLFDKFHAAKKDYYVTASDIVKASDYLVDIYERKNNKKWYEDNLFKGLISNFTSNFIYADIESKNLSDYKKYNIDEYSLTDTFKDTFEKMYNEKINKYNISNRIILNHNKYYYKVNFNGKDYLIDYDFDNNKILKFIEINS